MNASEFFEQYFTETSHEKLQRYIPKAADNLRTTWKDKEGNTTRAGRNRLKGMDLAYRKLPYPTDNPAKVRSTSYYKPKPLPKTDFTYIGHGDEHGPKDDQLSYHHDPLYNAAKSKNRPRDIVTARATKRENLIKNRQK